MLQRGATQGGLLAAVLMIVVAGTALLGTSALLLTTAQDQALTAAMRHAAPDRVDVTAVVRTGQGDRGIPDPTQVRAGTAAALTAAFDPFPSTTDTWLSSAMLFLPSETGVRRYGYLEEVDGIADHSRLVAGRWPVATAAGPLEVAILRSTARALDLSPGSSTTLSASSEPSPGSEPATTLVVVGVFTPAPGQAGAWVRDPIGGAGFSEGTQRLPAYGPFVVAPASLLSVGVEIDQMSIVARPDLSDAADPHELEQVGAALNAARTDMSSVLGNHVTSISVHSPFPATLAIARTQGGVTGSGVMAMALLGAGLAGTALGLAGRLVAARRAAETALLSARGASRSQLVRNAAVEAVALAAVGIAVTIPLALALYRVVVMVPPLARAGLAPQVAATPTLVLTIAAGAAGLAVMLVAPSLRAPDRSGTRRRIGGLVARSGADLILTAVAVVGYFQLRAHRVATTAEIDPVLVAAPVLCLLAGAVLVLRVLPLVARLAEVHAGRSRSLTVPLAGWELARRPHATSGAFLLVLAAAVATFGLSFTQTWSTSQQDQADVEVGTDLAVSVGAAPLTQGRALAQVTGSTPSPVTARPIGLGSRAGGGATGVTRLVALNTRQARELLRGPLPADQSWTGLTEGLAPDQPSGGVLLPSSEVLTLSVSGTSKDGTPLLAAPTLILEDSWGDRLAVAAPGAALDGQPHVVQVDLGYEDGLPIDSALRLVAMDLTLDLGEGAQVSPGLERSTGVTVAVQVVDGTAAPDTGDAPWSATQERDAYEISNVAATQATGTGGATVTASATVSRPAMLYQSPDLVVAAFAIAAELPIAVSADLATSLDLKPGDTLNLSIDTVSIPAVVVRVVPYVPSAARNPGVMADYDGLSRAVIGQGNLTTLTDAWWVGDMAGAQAAAAAVRAQHLGEPVTRLGVATDLREGPLRAPLRAAIWLLVASAVVLALAGTAVHTAASLEARSVDVARLQGLGVPRRAVVTSFLLQHGAVSLLAVAAGAGVGALVAAVAGPLLIVSPTGLAPIPDPRFIWPWLAQGALVAVLLLGSALVAAPVAIRVIRRATVAHLRMDAS
ncbi:MAG: FtsX-like permease family protein [Cellulomonas sp.]